MRRSFPSRLQDSAGPVPAMLTLGFANKIVWLCLARWRWERLSAFGLSARFAAQNRADQGLSRFV